MKYKAIFAALCSVLLLGGCVPSEPVFGTIVDKYVYTTETTYIDFDPLILPIEGERVCKIVVRRADGTVGENVVSQSEYYSYEIGDEYPRPLNGEHDDTP